MLWQIFSGAVQAQLKLLITAPAPQNNFGPNGSAILKNL